MSRMKSAVAAAICAGMLLLSINPIANAAWVNATGNLSGMSTECGDFQSIYAIPNSNITTIGLANVGLFATTNGGTTWTKMTDSVKVRLMQMLFDPASANTWYVGGIYHQPGIWKTTDAGATWIGFHGIGTNDGFSVDFSDPQRKTILAGGHESQGNLYRSTDGGATWANIGCPSGGFSSFPYIVNTQTYLMGLYNNSMQRSTNAGVSWTQVSSTGPISHLLTTAAGDLFYTGGGKLVRSTDNGATWTTLQTISVAGAAPIEVAAGKIAIINSNGISFSTDKGATWTTNRCAPIPSAMLSFWNFNGAIGLTYNSVAGAFYTFKWGCGSTVASDEIWRFDTMVAGGSEVTMPRHGAPAFAASILDMQKTARVFDVTGRMIGRDGSQVAGICVVKSMSGRVSKHLIVSR